MRPKTSIGTVIAVAVIFSLAFPGITLGVDKFTLRPKLAAKWQTDSNFYKTETTEREVHTYLVQPGLVIGYQTDKSVITLDYTLNAYYYDDQDDVTAGQTKAENDDYVGHNAAFKAKTNLFDQLTLSLDASYSKTRDPADSTNFSNSVARNKYDLNRLTPAISYDFADRFSLGLSYRNEEKDFDLSTKEDDSENRGILDLIYNYSRTASLILQYQRWEKDYELTTSDFTSDRAMLTLKKQFKYFTFEAGGGYHERDFDNVSLASIDTGVYRVAVAAQNPPAPEKPRSRISIASEMDFSDSSIFTAHKQTLTASHTFLKKLTIKINASYQNADYQQEAGLTPSKTTELRNDDTYTLSGSIGYLFTDTLTFSLGSDYEERDSNLADKDYDNRSIWAQLAFAYDFGGK